MIRFIVLLMTLIAGPVLPTIAEAQDPAITYQGQLRQDGQPFTGMANLEFALFDQLTAGTSVGGPLMFSGWPIEDGLFQVELDFGTGAFDGGERFLEVRVDGAPLTPRQRVTATPYALLAAGAAAGSVDGVAVDPAEIQLRVVGTCPAGEYVQEVGQDGSVTCGVDADSGGTLIQLDTGAGLTGGPITDTGTISVAPGGIGTAEIDPGQVQLRVAGTCPAGEYVQQVGQDGSVTCGVDAIGSSGWSLSGNAGTNPATDFLGTTDATPLVLRTGNAPGLRIEPSAATFGTPALPITTNTIGGSHANEVIAGVRGATIAGGGVPGGNSDPEFASEAPNLVTDHFGTVGGGFGNLAGDNAGDAFDSTHTTVGGGARNTASGSSSTVSGGIFNTANGTESTISGGSHNTASGSSSSVGGGAANNAVGSDSTIGGGLNNTASLDYGTVGGGALNFATGNGSTVAGGTENIASGDLSTVGGGHDNMASGIRSTVGGGIISAASGSESTVGGGAVNMASGGWTTVGGGAFNTASNSYSSVSGGRENCAGGEYSWAAGRRAKARPGSDSEDPGNGCSGVTGSGDADGDNGTFVWADSQDVDFVSTGENQFLIRAAGGTGINTNVPRAPLTVQGEGKWNPTIGNGFGDFHIGNEDFGLAIGVANGPGLGAGAVRFWPKGGNEAIVFTTASSYPGRTLTLSDTGLVGVRRNPSSNALEVAGNASKTTAGSWLANSDRRIKTDVREIPGALDKLLRLRPVTFRYAEAYRDAHPELDEARYYNVIAQEFARVFPEAVKGSGEYLPGLPETPDNEILQVDTHPAVITSIAAVQELAVRLERTESRNASLKAELDDLRTELARLRERVDPRLAETGAR